MFRRGLTMTVAGASLLTLAGCSGVLDVNGMSNVNMRLATQPASAISAAEHSIALGGNTLVITGVQLVAREIELEAEDGACAAASAVLDSTSSHDDGCEEVEIGPVLLDLPLTPGTAQGVSATVQAGTFNSVQFEIHVPDDDDAADQAFRAAHPDFTNASVRVTGTFNGTPFTFTSNVDAEQEINLPTPLVTTGGAASLTLFVDLDKWFVTADGTGLVDPALAGAGGAFQSVVEGNIKASFHAFEDENHDGSDDSAHGGSGS